jgi:hypothetical protein
MITRTRRRNARWRAGRKFAMIMTGETTLPNEIETGIATVTGNLEAVNEVIDSFDKVAKDRTNPGHLHN